MIWYTRTSYTICLLLWTVLLLVIPGQGIGADGTLAGLYAKAQGGSEFERPQAQELATARRLFGHMFAGQEPGGDGPGWDSLGYAVQTVQDQGRSYLVIRETHHQGQGMFVFALDSRSRTALMVPHGMKDLHTANLGIQCMQRGDFIALALNTMPRYTDSGRDLEEQDLAHVQATLFTVFTKAFAQAFPSGRLVQVHGFAQGKRRTQAGKRAEVILSTGSPVLTQDIFDLARCLDQDISGPVTLYPLQVQELGGTTNVSGNILQSMGHTGFVHCELAYPLRKRLLHSSRLQGAFVSCLELVP